MTASNIARVLRDVLTKAVAAIPQYILKCIEAFFPWYIRLSFVSMFLVTGAIGVGAIILLSLSVFSANVKSEGTHLIAAVLTLWFLLVIMVGVIRPGRR